MRKYRSKLNPMTVVSLVDPNYGFSYSDTVKDLVNWNIEPVDSGVTVSHDTLEDGSIASSTYEFDLPGVSKESIQVSFDDPELTIKATRSKSKKYNYTIAISHMKVDEESIEAKYDNGVLTVVLKHRVEKAEKPKSIKVL